MVPRPHRRCGLAVAVLVALLSAAAPQTAAAHGPADPVATDYLAKVARAPAGVDAKVVDGYLRMWLRVPPSETVEVLDYLGAPYLRFSRSGVYVNERSEMYYLNYAIPLNPPASLTKSTPPRWHRVSSGHEYNWHDGRLGGLTDTVLAPGASYVGKWSISVLVNGHLSAISGGLWHAGSPSIVWFWPPVVLFACLLAAFRLRRANLDARLTRALALMALIAIAVGATGRELHGRPIIGVSQLVLLGLTLAFVAWATVRILRRRPGAVLVFAVAMLALAVGLELAPTLVYGFVLIALPAFVARAATVLCLASAAALLPLALRLADRVP